jgi:hypothetical protein
MVPVRIAVAVALTIGAASAARAQQPTQDLDAAPRLRLVEELRLGSATDPNTGFSRVGSVAVDRDGQLYVFEVQDRHIRVFGATGRLLRTIGRAGNGPGEFAAPTVSVGISGDTVVALSGAGRAMNITLFNRATGAFLSTVRIDGVAVPGRGSSMLVFLPQLLRADGALLSGDIWCRTRAARRPPASVTAILSDCRASDSTSAAPSLTRSGGTWSRRASRRLRPRGFRRSRRPRVR